MGLILWIDQNTFATSLLEKVFKKKNLPLYTVSSAENFNYLVEDLKPQLIVLDSKTALAHFDAFKEQYKSLRGLPFILVDGTEELSFIEKVIGKIERPFDPFTIPDRIQKILSAN